MTSRSDVTRVLVVGGGIGGVATALACARQGIDVRVLEQAQELSEIGAGLQLGPNGVRTLRSFGVLDAVERTAVPPRRIVLLDVDTDEEIFAINCGEEFVARYGERYTVMHRGDLFAALLDSARATGLVEVLPRKTVVGIDQNDSGATAHCADGTSYTGEVLIGADGLRSYVRQVVIGDGDPLVSDYVVYRGPGPRPDGIEDAVKLYAGHRHHIMQYPIQGGEQLNRVFSFKSTRGAPGSETWGTPEELFETFANASDYVKSALESVDVSKRWLLCDRRPTPGWTQGRVTLLGDAAHAMRQYLAQGAVQAIEDADVLARCLVQRADDVTSALKAYEEIRYPRTTAVQQVTRFWGELSHVGGIARTMRDYTLRQLGDRVYDFFDWLYLANPPAPLQVPDSLGLYDELLVGAE